MFDKLVEECTESIEEIEIASENKHKNKCRSCTPYIALFSIIFTVIIKIAVYFVYSHWCFKNDGARVILLY